MGRPKLYHTEEERREARRLVSAKYAVSEKGRATTARTNASPLAPARYARYRETQGYRDAQERRRQKQMATGWPASRIARERLRAEHPEMMAAHRAVQVAVRAGRLEVPDRCTRCAATTRLHGHHYLGYQPEHRLDVQWLCSKCHKAAHL